MAMTALDEAVRSYPHGSAARRHDLRIDRIACGILLVAVGAGWLLDRFGVAVPWRLGAPIALTLVGATLSIAVLVTRDGGMRVWRSGLAWLGAALLALSVALGVSASQYVAPAGTSTLLPPPRIGPSRSVEAWAISIWISPGIRCRIAGQHRCTWGPAMSQ